MDHEVGLDSLQIRVSIFPAAAIVEAGCGRSAADPLVFLLVGKRLF
jgi:hypothetical protein